MATQDPPLPADRTNQTYVTVKALCVGRVYLENRFVFEDSMDEPESAGLQLPVFSFLISHPTKGHAMFDLGIRKVCTHSLFLATLCPTNAR